ncbi:MAG: hypothetical protein K2O34_08215 [Acetatifactor sp.]|nr:hypothetical protein [Acetatifactor sp.]
MEDVERALEEVKTSLTRRIEEKDYPFLLKMLQASVALEYNGRRWHNVHPLVVKFFEEQGLIEDAGE